MSEVAAGGATRPGRGGRPRSSRLDRAILDAAMALLDEVGLERLTMDAVAQRAGVSKMTVYRRWDSKYALAAAALDQVRPLLTFPDTGSLTGDLDLMFRAAEQGMGDTRIRQMSALLLRALISDDRFRGVYWAAFVEPRRAQLRESFVRAKRRGQLREDVDIDMLIDIVAGSIFYQALRPAPEPLVERLRRALALLLESFTPDPSPS